MRLRDLREDRDLTQKQVADFLSIKQNTYSQYENGVRQLPIDLLIRLSRYYTVSTDYILELTNVPEPYPQKAKRLCFLHNVCFTNPGLHGIFICIAQTGVFLQVHSSVLAFSSVRRRFSLCGGIRKEAKF